MVEPIASTSKVAASPARGHRRKKTAENWDDDFEFALSARSKPAAPRPSLRQEDGRPLSAAKINGRRSSSPIENWGDEDWDTCDAGPSRSPPRSKRPLPLNIPAANGQPPRMSSSHSLSLPPPSPERRSPLTASLESDRPFLNAQSDAGRRSRPSSAMSAASKIRSAKGQPPTSSSQLPAADTVQESATLSVEASARHSSHIVDPASKQAVRLSKSREEMPPPPTPGFLGRKSSVKRTPSARSGVRESMIPFSPSTDQIEAAEAKKPGFWKRLSGAQGSSSPARALARSPSDRRRRRSSSTGGRIPSDPSLHPPLPPYPPNLRSSSATSATSSQSAGSNASDRSGAGSGVASVLRRSSSRLSEQPSPSTPPSSYPYGAPSASKSSVNMPIPESGPLPIPRREQPSPALQPSASFSRGYHLPSPSPKSPYNVASVGLGTPPFPHSSSFPNNLTAEKQKKGSDSDTETEADGSVQTPKRRKKIRPVSALPAPRRESGWGGDGWKGFTVSPTAPAIPISRTQLEESPSFRSPSAAGPPVAPHTAPMPSTSTFKKIATLSKQHGRRLSGGWKFGGGSPSASDQPSTGSQLETVVGSPSKPAKNHVDIPGGLDGRALGFGETELDEMRDTFRAGSVSAPGSRLQPKIGDQLPSQISESAVSEAAKAEKQRRRQSWNDFVIPREVLEKQKELKQGIGAVKQFATGVESLRSLLDSHAVVQSRIIQSGETDEISLYTTLERDFAQYWEMATVLIEVGSTGQSTLDSSAGSAMRSRRVTLAAEDAKAAADAMRRTYSNPDEPAPASSLKQCTPKKGSLPEPGSIGLGGPPRASPTHWRASTGRQDLSKRQLEVLRSMLRTPISDSDRPSVGLRQASTLSASSTQSHIVKSSVNPTRSLPFSVVSPNDTPDSKISYPSPGDSTYIVPSGSFPSPTTASIPYPQAKRRSSRAGLAGLKDFLRGLRTQKSSGDLTSTPSRATADVPPVPRTMPPTPISPVHPSGTFSREEIFYPSQRHTMFTPLGPATRRGPSPEKKSQTRPSIRNIFRTSSGNWSELVRAQGGSRRSSEQDRVPSATSSQEHLDAPPVTLARSGHRASPSIIGQVKMKGQGILRRPSVEQFSKSPDLNIDSATTPRSPRGSRKARPSVSVPAEAAPSPTKGPDERTVRPSRKSRMKGLGFPSEGLDNLAERGSPPQSPRKASAGTMNSIGTFNSHSTSSSEVSGHYGESGARRGPEVGREDDEDEMPTLALTPDNLPVLLEYLRQCEAKLGEWRVRAEGFLTR